MSKAIKILLVLIVYSIFYEAKAQLIANQKMRLLPDEASVEEFIFANKFEYALVVWSTSNWMNSKDQFSFLVKINGDWYSMKVLSPIADGSPELTPLSIKQILLNKAHADSLINVMKPEAAFRYSQLEFNKLPDTCSYLKNGKRTGLIYGITDAGTYHLLELSGKKIRVLNFYAPKMYLSTCYPYVSEFGILKGFVNTCVTLQKSVEGL